MTGRRHTVLVMGAGASVSEAMGFRPRRHTDHPPLDATFFRRVENHAAPALLNRVKRHAQEIGAPDLSASVSLEEHLGRLYFDMRNAEGDETRRAYYDLVRLYYTELITTTNWLIGRAGSVKRVIARELGETDKLSIITFNHDLLAESAISELPVSRYGHAKCLGCAYEFPKAPPTIENRTAKFDFTCPPGGQPHISLYKVHGSVNWVFRTRAPYPPSDITRSDARRMFVWINRQLPAHETTLRTGRLWHMWPLIVPPIYEKQGLIRNELQEIWRRAGEAMKSATRVLFWGYSFPRADLHARYFFQSAAHANPGSTTPS